MGGQDYRKKLSFRATEEEVAKVESLVKASGLSQQEYLLSAALGGVVNSSHHTLLVAASNVDNTKVSAGGSSGGSLKGIEAKAVLLEAKVSWLKSANGDNEKVAYYDGALWLIGKDSHSQDLLKKLLEFPVELFEEVAARGRDHTLAECREALARWNDLKAMECIGDVTIKDGDEQVSPLSLSICCFTDWLFNKTKRDVVEAIEAYKASLKEAVAVVEPANDGVAIEAVEQPQTPYIEVVVERPLTKAKFCKETGLDGSSQHYNMACQAGRTADGYLASDGSRWKMSGKAKKAFWTKVAVAPGLVEAIA